MTAKEYLLQLHRIDQLIELAEENVRELRDSATCLGSPGFDESYNPNKPTSAPYEKIMAMVVDQEKRLEELVQKKQMVLDSINGLRNSDERLVLTYRYLHNMTWRAIGREIFVDHKTVMKIHDSALKKLKFEKNSPNSPNSPHPAF